MDGLLEIIKGIIQSYGYFGIFSLTALEQFILPIPADVFIAFGTSAGLPLKTILIFVIVGALIGAYIGYFLGKWMGHPIALKVFGKHRLDITEQLIKKYGIWGVIIAGLTPIPFQLATWTSGIFEMPLGRYTLGVLLGRIPRYLLTGWAAHWFFSTKFYATTEMSAVILGTLQGLTEFLPISSSGHLAIAEYFLKLPETISTIDLKLFDIFLHGGSLLAILIFFWRDWLKVLRELWTMLTRRAFDLNTLAAKLILGTLPAIAIGLLFGDLIGNELRCLASIATFLILIGTLYLYAEWKAGKNTHESVNIKKTMVIGAAQAVALIPGISRSGTTIAMGMLMGLNREAAARFSFMLGGIAILAANVYAIFSIRQGAAMPHLTFTLLGTAVSFLASLASIHWLLKFLRKHTLRPFAAYVILLGTLILTFF